MSHHWKILGYPTILAMALAALPATVRSAPPGDKSDAPPPSSTAKDLERIEKGLQKMGGEIARDIKDLREDFNFHIKKTQGDIDGLKSQMEQLRKDLDSLRKGTPTVSNYGPANKDVEELSKQLELVRQTLNAIRQQLPTTSTSLKPADNTGRIRLVNDFPSTAEVVVNGARYLLEPGMTRELPMPAGPFTYRVPMAGIADQNRVLAAHEALTITVYPR